MKTNDFPQSLLNFTLVGSDSEDSTVIMPFFILDAILTLHHMPEKRSKPVKFRDFLPDAPSQAVQSGGSADDDCVSWVRIECTEGIQGGRGCFPACGRPSNGYPPLRSKTLHHPLRPIVPDKGILDFLVPYQVDTVPEMLVTAQTQLGIAGKAP